MSGAKAWYWNRRAFKRHRILLDAARRLDANLLRFYEGREDWPKKSYQQPRVDLGKVTWGRFESVPLHNRYRMWRDDRPHIEVDSDDEGFCIPASTIEVPDFPHDVIPLHMTTLCHSDLMDSIIGCEDFGGGECNTTVYFAEGCLTGLIKIGLATDPVSRLSSIRTSTTEPVQLIGRYMANRAFEGFLHGLFEPLRHHGEWFYPHWSIYSVALGDSM